MGEVKVARFGVGMLGTNCYLVMETESGEGFIIDPGGDSATVLEAVEDLDMKPLGILCTHGHMDHVGAVGKVARATGAPVYISKEDAGVLEGSPRGLGERLSSIAVSKPGSVRHLSEGDLLAFGDREMEVLHTPGHTRGSLSFLCNGYLFCGDLIFQGSIGRTDLRGGSLADLLAAVKSRVLGLPGATRIMPGHGPATTISEEGAHNPYLRDL